MVLDFIIWNVDPEIFSFGRFAIRWYGLFFALSFYFGYMIFVRFFKKEKVEIELLDKLTLYMALGTIMGARLGHCLFYEPSYYLKNPVEILMIWKGGLASHGAAIGIVLAMYLFSRKFKKPFFWILDRIVIVVALSGFFIRSGNLMNSEIYGEPTKSKNGFIYTRSFSRYFDDAKEVKKIHFKKVPGDSIIGNRFVPIEANIEFSKKIRTKEQAERYIFRVVDGQLSRDTEDLEENVVYPPLKDFEYSLEKKGTAYEASFIVWGAPKHASQIYEAMAYLLIFLLLLGLYYKNNAKLFGGFLFGLFLVLVFSARFAIEHIKENQVAFEQNLPLNMGQLLSLPLVLAGLFFIIYSLKTKKLM